jgi:hypothetical protein
MAANKYVSHSFDLSDGQMKSVIEAIKSKEPIVLKLSKKSFTNGKIE